MNQEAHNLIPKPRPAADFARRLAEAARDRIKSESAEKYRLPSGSCYALTCNRSTSHIGILFAEGVDPMSEQMIHGGMWFAAYHELGDPARSRDEIICSQCLVESGEEQPLRVESVMSPRDLGYCFKIPSTWRRFVHVVGADRIRQLLGSPEPEPKPEPPKPEPKPQVQSAQKMPPPQHGGAGSREVRQ